MSNLDKAVRPHARTEIPRCLVCKKKLEIKDRFRFSFGEKILREEQHFDTKEQALREAKSQGLVVNGVRHCAIYDEDLDDFIKNLNSGTVYVSPANPRRGLWGLGHFCTQSCAASYGEDAAARAGREA